MSNGLNRLYSPDRDVRTYSEIKEIISKPIHVTAYVISRGLKYVWNITPDDELRAGVLLTSASILSSFIAPYNGLLVIIGAPAMTHGTIRSMHKAYTERKRQQ